MEDSTDIERLLAAGLSGEDVEHVLEGRWSRPRWLPGDSVRVVENERNAPLTATVRLIRWHHNQRQWMYYLEDGKRNVSKRFWSCDLATFAKALPSASGLLPPLTKSLVGHLTRQAPFSKPWGSPYSRPSNSPLRQQHQTLWSELSRTLLETGS